MRAAANGAHTLQNVPDYYNKEEELHMNQFTKAVKSLAAKYNETSLILRIAIGLLIGAVLALICPGAVCWKNSAACLSAH